MHNFKYLLILLSSITFVAGAHASDSGTYQVDPMHSKVGFEISHLVISSVEGKFTDFSGSIILNDESFEKSKFKSEVQVNSIDTGVKKRDDHLRSKDFFEVSKHPIMKFESYKIQGKKNKFKLIGDLTIKGIKKRVTFDGKYLGTVKDGYGNLKAAFKAQATIKRQDFGLTWSSVIEAGPVVGDDVTISLNIQAAKPLEKKQANNN